MNILKSKVAQMMRTKDWTAHLADIDMNGVPGMSFQYKEWDVMLLSAVIGKAFGGTAYDFVQKYLYEPLAITSGEWPQSPCGFSYIHMNGEENANLSARDLAKIGLLFLEKGVYNGKQLISAGFVEQAVTPMYENVAIGSSKNTDSYGFLWWLFQEGYGCRGSGGQEINVIPANNYVSVIQAVPTSSAKAYGDVEENILKKAIVH
ncbi:hypothetical protein EHS13_04400 [Paenibacillus psychroresistens]|uniref:Beta-lactamase-related domain-containing protein n=1 Tax=Paenibacillus psychroresistens TaxID=1778678 RepID=A0A6B8RCH8_9BACL|nr:serine hydrolase [Paenibacillus psychroresistens]QGQ94201.1 hypothetical protein EHS13_04400 [Paenibacillus psychroresistens]